MPYIPQKSRRELDPDIVALAKNIKSEGELNYAIMRLVILLLKRGTVSYSRLNSMMGVLSCVSAEFYRRIMARYENEKIRENGDLFGLNDLFT